MTLSESSDDIPLAQRPGQPSPVLQRKPVSSPVVKPGASQIASSCTPANGGTRKSSATVPAEEKEPAPEGGTQASVKAARKSNTLSQSKGRPSKGAATGRASERSGDSVDVKKQTQPNSTTEKPVPKVPAPAKNAAKSGTSGANSEKTKRERPQYDMPGQTQPTPDAAEPLAKFYLSLMQQRTDSEIAPKWCVQRGLLPREEAESWLQKNGKSTGKAVKKDTAAPKRAATNQASTAKAKQRRKQSEAFAGDTSGDDGDDYREADAKPSKKAKTAAPAQSNKKSAVKPKAAARQPKAAAKKQVSQASGDDDSDDEPLEGKKPAAKATASKVSAAKAPAAKAPAVKASAAKAPAAKTASRPKPPPVSSDSPTPVTAAKHSRPKPKPPPVPSDSDSSDAPLAQKKQKARA